MEKDSKTHAVIGAAKEAHRVLGPGFLEVVYQEALARELSLCGNPFRPEYEILALYKGEKVATV